MPDYKQKAGYSFCSDKFQLGKFTKLAGEEVSTVRIKECPLQIETLVQRISTRQDFAIVEREIVAIFVEEGFYMIQLISMWINGNLLSINSENIQLPTSR